MVFVARYLWTMAGSHRRKPCPRVAIDGVPETLAGCVNPWTAGLKLFIYAPKMEGLCRAFLGDYTP